MKRWITNLMSIGGGHKESISSFFYMCIVRFFLYPYPDVRNKDIV